MGLSDTPLRGVNAPHGLFRAYKDMVSHATGRRSWQSVKGFLAESSWLRSDCI